MAPKNESEIQVKSKNESEAMAAAPIDHEVEIGKIGKKQARSRTMFNMVAPFALQETVKVTDPIVSAEWTIARLDNKEYSEWLKDNQSGVFDRAMEKVQPLLHKQQFENEIKKRNKKTNEKDKPLEVIEAIEGAANSIDWDQIQKDSVYCDIRVGLSKHVVKDISPLDIVRLRCDACESIIDFSEDAGVCVNMLEIPDSPAEECGNEKWEYVQVSVPYTPELGLELLSDDSSVPADFIKEKFPQPDTTHDDDGDPLDDPVKFKYNDSTLGAVLTRFLVLETAKNKSLFDKMIQEEALANLESA